MSMNSAFLLILPLIAKTALGQPNSADDILLHTVPGHAIPENLLSMRSAAFYDPLYTQNKLKKIQNAFQKTGIDTEAFFRSEKSFAGMDFCRALSSYLVSRKIKYLVFLQKNHNHLINEFPEEPSVNYFSGHRNESFTRLALTQRIAIPVMGDEAMNAKLAKCFDTMKLNYKMVDPKLTDGQLREQGFAAVLRFVHTQGKLAWELLGYDKDKMASGISGVSYSEGNPRITTQASETTVYKFYFKHLDFGDVYLGNTWDADPQWERSLSNHLHALMKETSTAVSKSQ